MSQIIRIDDYAARGTLGHIELGQAVEQAAIRAHCDEAVTYLAGDGYCAVLVPLSALKDAKDEHEALPVLVRAEHPRRRPWWTRGPFEGVFE